MRILDDKGMTLIGVTWVILILAILAAVVLRLSLSSNKLALRREHNVQQELTAESAVTLFVKTSFFDPEERSFHGGMVTLDATEVVVEVTFENGRVDLNRAPEYMISATLASMGLDEDQALSLAAAIVDWRDADDNAEGVGAEKVEYQAAGRSYGPRNGAFETVGELQRVLGMTNEIFECLAPVVTVYSRNQLPEVYNASEAVRNVYRWARAQNWQEQSWPDVDETLATPLSVDDIILTGRAFQLDIELLGRDGAKFRQFIRVKTTDDMSFRPLTSLLRAPGGASSNTCSFSAG